MDKVAFYIRVSTTMQVEEGLSLDTQIAACRDYASSKGLKGPFCIYMDAGLSGGSISGRPSMTLLLEDIQSNYISHFIVTKLDRAFRNVKDACESLEKIKQAGVHFIILDLNIDSSTPSGEFMFHLMAAFSQFERKQVGERVHAVNKRLVMEGRHVGGHKPPFGYRRDPDTMRLYPDGEPMGGGLPSPAEIVRRVFREFLRDRTTGANGIARRLNLDGIPTSDGKLWGTPNVFRILRNPVYKGEIRYGKNASRKMFHFGREMPEGTVTAQGNHEPLIPLEEWDAAHEKMMGRRKPGRDPSPKTPYSGLVFCGHCGNKAYSTTGGDRKWKDDLHFFKCSQVYKKNKASCPDSKSIQRNVFEDLIYPAIDANCKAAKSQGFVRRKQPRPKAGERDRLWQLNRIQGRFDRLKELYIEGDISPERYATEKAALNAELDRIGTADSPPLPDLPVSSVMMDFMGFVTDPDVSVVTKREEIEQLVERILLYGDRVVIHYRERPYRGWAMESDIRRPLAWERPKRPRNYRLKGIEKETPGN